MARKSYSPESKFSIVLEALKERKTLQEIASEHGIAPSQISHWLDELNSRDNKPAKWIKLLEAEHYEPYAKIGKLTASDDWLKKTEEAVRL